MKKTMIAMMLVASTATFAAEEAKKEAPAAPAQQEQEKGVVDSAVDAAKGVWTSITGLFD